MQRGDNMNENPQNQIIIYKTDDGKSNITLFARDGSVWLNQNQLAELFATSKPNISIHISNILKEKELQEESVVKYYLTTASDGKQYSVAEADREDMAELDAFEAQIIKKHPKQG